MQNRPTLGALSKQGLCHSRSVENTTENLQKINLAPKKNNFLGYEENTYDTISPYGKMFIIEFSYNFLYLWSCMGLLENKFPIHENCMICIFGQPGS